MTGDEGPGAGGGRCALEPPGRFSRSVLWRLMSKFYMARGVGAFGAAPEGAARAPTVPSFVTSNAAHGARMRDCTVGWLASVRPCSAKGDYA